ncbi:MAG: nuclear transport factor 2 family protein [Pacificimonas sp.]
MTDDIWNIEQDLWTGDASTYRRFVADDCLMVLPEQPHLMTGKDAIDAVANTPRWEAADLDDRKEHALADGLVVIGYRAKAKRDDERYTAWCTSVHHRTQDGWRVVQHQQTVEPVANV